MSHRRVNDKKFDCVLLFPDSWLHQKFDYKFVLDGTMWVTSRVYPKEKDSRGNENNCLTVESGFLPSIPPGIYETIQVPRGLLNSLHTKMAREGFSEVFVSMESDETMVIVRQNPVTMESYALIARSYYWNNATPTGLHPVKLPGVLSSVELITQLSLSDTHFVPDGEEINGYRGTLETFGNLAHFASVSRM